MAESASPYQPEIFTSYAAQALSEFELDPQGIHRALCIVARNNTHIDNRVEILADLYETDHTVQPIKVDSSTSSTHSSRAAEEDEIEFTLETESIELLEHKICHRMPVLPGPHDDESVCNRAALGIIFDIAQAQSTHGFAGYDEPPATAAERAYKKQMRNLRVVWASGILAAGSAVAAVFEILDGPTPAGFIVGGATVWLMGDEKYNHHKDERGRARDQAIVAAKQARQEQLEAKRTQFVETYASSINIIARHTSSANN